MSVQANSALLTKSTGAPPSLGGFRLTVWRTVVLIGFLVFWEWAANYLIDPFFVSKPTDVAERLWQQTSNGMLFMHSAVTLWEALLGLALGFPVGVGCGILLAAWPRFAQVIEPFWMGLYSLPRIALAPLFIIWFGIGLVSKVALVFSMVVFIFILNIRQGMREVDKDLIDLMRTMRASRAYILMRVQLPSILPWIIAAFRINVAMALIGAVLGEMLGANRGIGWYIVISGARLDTAGVFVGLLVLMVMALLMNEVIRRVEYWFIRYKQNP